MEILGIGKKELCQFFENRAIGNAYKWKTLPPREALTMFLPCCQSLRTKASKPMPNYASTETVCFVGS
jgi:hypothetical protein